MSHTIKEFAALNLEPPQQPTNAFCDRCRQDVSYCDISHVFVVHHDNLAVATTLVEYQRLLRIDDQAGVQDYQWCVRCLAHARARSPFDVKALTPFSWGVYLTKDRLGDLPQSGLSITIPHQPHDRARRVTQVVTPPGTHATLWIGEKGAANVDGVMPAELSSAALILPMQAARLEITLDEKNRACLEGGAVGVKGFDIYEVL